MSHISVYFNLTNLQLKAIVKRVGWHWKDSC